MPDGKVLYRQYFRGTVSSNFDLHEFPFDRHELELHIEATSGEVDDVRVRGWRKAARVMDRTRRPASCPTVGTCWRRRARSPRIAIHDCTKRIRGSRFGSKSSENPHYYWWSIVLPLLPIVVTSWSVFWMDPKEFGSQIGVGVTAMLTVVAYRITIDSSLPPLTYMTRMDYFLLVCQVLVFGSFILSVLAHACFTLETAEMVTLAKRINQRCRWVPPLAMAVTCTLLLLLPAGLAMTIVCCSLWCRVACLPAHAGQPAALVPGAARARTVCARRAPDPFGRGRRSPFAGRMKR